VTRHRSADSVNSDYRAAVRRLAGAQKPPDGPAYSIWVNRRLGRLAAAGAHVLGLAPNHVTAVSAGFSATAIVLIALVPGWMAGLAAAVLLAVGYVLDAADGQLARLRGGGSLAGEWLDHMVDAVKTTSLHAAVLVHLYRFADLDPGWLLVPLGYTVVAVALFFAQLLNDQLPRTAQVAARPTKVPAATGTSPVAALLKLPRDYGVLCWVFVLLGAPGAFLAVYGLLCLYNLGYLPVAAVVWFRRMQALDSLAAS
jgi:phosphatidylglycerophosphate synthase